MSQVPGADETRAGSDSRLKLRIRPVGAKMLVIVRLRAHTQGAPQGHHAPSAGGKKSTG